MIHLDYRDGRPIYQQIQEGFREQIRAGVLLEGDRMPSVRELATVLAINPNTIQRAYRELEAEGWIASVAGKGSFVCGAPEGDAAGLLDQFDDITAKLLRQGIRPEELIARILEGGERDA